MVVAEYNQFDKSTYSAPAWKPFQICFQNFDGGKCGCGSHNFAVYASEGGKRLFGARSASDLVKGLSTKIYRVPPQKPGRYYFQSDPLSDTALMNGTFVVK